MCNFKSFVLTEHDDHQMVAPSLPQTAAQGDPND